LEVGRQIIRIEGFDLKGEEAECGETKVQGAAGTVNEHGDADRQSLVLADDVESFLDATAFGDDVFNDEDFFAGRDFEAAAEGEFAFLFFDEDKSDAELAGDFLAKNKAAHGRRNNGGSAKVANLGGEFSAKFFDDGHLLKGEGALKELAAVEAAAEDKVAFEQSAGVAEDLEDFVVGH
jgi:hypothetical protein